MCCPKCGSIMYLERDYNGKYWACICGKHINLEKALPYAPGIEDKRKENW